MFEYKTTLINGNVYISECMSDEEYINIPIYTKTGEKIYGIDSFAFIGTEMKEISFPHGLEDIKENAFIDCFNLQTVHFYNENPLFTINVDKSFKKETSNILFLIHSKNYSNYEESKNFIIIGCEDDFMENKKASYIEYDDSIEITSLPEFYPEIYIPETYKGKPIYFNFSNIYYPDIKKIRVPSSLRISKLQFKGLKEICFAPDTKDVYLSNTNLEKIIMYDKVETINARSDVNLNHLKVFTVDESIQILKSFILDSIQKSEWFRELEPSKDGSVNYNGLLLKAPTDKYLEYYNIPNNVLFIVDGLFSNYKMLKKIVFNKQIRNISSECFYNCRNLKILNIPKNIKYIGERAFYEEIQDNCNDNSPYGKEVSFEGNQEEIEIKEDCFTKSIWLPFR